MVAAALAEYDSSKQKSIKLGIANFSHKERTTPCSKMSTTPSIKTPNSTSKYSHLGFKDSIEKCKRVMAEERQRHLDDMKETAKSEVTLRRMARNRVVNSLRQNAHNYGMSAKDHAIKLVENAMRETQARLELECHEEIKKKVYKDHEKLYEMFDQERREDIVTELRESLEPVVVSRLELAKIDEVKAALAQELKGEVIHNLKVELEDDIRTQLRAELEQDVKACLHTSLKDEVCEQLRDYYTQQVIRDLKEELTPILIEEIRHEQYTASSQHTSTDDLVSNHAIADNTSKKAVMNEKAPEADRIAQVGAGATTQEEILTCNTDRIAFIASETTIHTHRLASPIESTANAVNDKGHETPGLALRNDPNAESDGSGAVPRENGGLKIYSDSNELIDPAFRAMESSSPTSSNFSTGATGAPGISRIFSDADQSKVTSTNSASLSRKRSFSGSSEEEDMDQCYVKRSRDENYTTHNDANFEEESGLNGYNSDSQNGYGSGIAQEDANEAEEENEDGELDYCLGPDGQPQYPSDGFFGLESDSGSECESEEEDNFQDDNAIQNVIRYSNTQETAINLDDSDDDVNGEHKVDRPSEKHGAEIEGDSTLVEDGGFIAVNNVI